MYIRLQQNNNIKRVNEQCRLCTIHILYITYILCACTPVRCLYADCDLVCYSVLKSPHNSIVMYLAIIGIKRLIGIRYREGVLLLVWFFRSILLGFAK